MSIVTWEKPHFKHMVEDASTTRKQRRTKQAASLAKAYAEVDLRDDGICVVTGVRTFTGAADERFRREHHHLKGRNIRPEWVTVPKRIVTVSALAHKLLTLNKLVIEGTDATKTLRVHWNPDTPAEQRCLVIKSRRTV